jgi:hypothetical protein
MGYYVLDPKKKKIKSDNSTFCQWLNIRKKNHKTRQIHLFASQVDQNVNCITKKNTKKIPFCFSKNEKAKRDKNISSTEKKIYFSNKSFFVAVKPPALIV